MTKSQTDLAAEIIEAYRKCFRNFNRHSLVASDSFITSMLPDTLVTLSTWARKLRSKWKPVMKVLMCGGRGLKFNGTKSYSKRRKA